MRRPRKCSAINYILFSLFFFLFFFYWFFLPPYYHIYTHTHTNYHSVLEINSFFHVVFHQISTNSCVTGQNSLQLLRFPLDPYYDLCYSLKLPLVPHRASLCHKEGSQENSEVLISRDVLNLG